MQKTLLTLACLACFSTAAVANTQVTVYGTIDLGFSFLNQNNGTHQFTMEDSQQTMDRIGIKGVEDLGNGYKVGFILENVITPTTVVLPIQNDYLIANPPYT